MIDWLNIYKHLLPNARAWRITIEKTLKRFFEGLTGFPEDIKKFIDDIFDDIDPQKTRQLDEWESQWGLQNTVTYEQERRDRLEATWKALGGQDPRYIQDTLQASGFDVYIHEWWEPIPGRPNGGSIDNDVIPVARNPFDYLDDGESISFLMTDGDATSEDGNPISEDGARLNPDGYPLVNKIVISLSGIISDGDGDMEDGNVLAEDGFRIEDTTYGLKPYVLPLDPTKYPYFLYIGGQTFPDQANVPFSRKEEFENLCLKICPLEQWLGILVTYV